MSSTFDTIANIIAETCDIPRDSITPESHAINDLGIDSLDFLDIAFAIDKAFGIKLPLEQWTQEVNDGKATTEQYFVLKNLARPHRRTRRRQGGLTQDEHMRLEYFQLIDRVVELNLADRKISTEATVPSDEHHLRRAFSRLSADAGRAADRDHGADLRLAGGRAQRFERMPFLAAVKDAKFRTFVMPGQVLTVDRRAEHDGSGYAMTEAQITCDGKPICDATLTLRVLAFPNAEMRRADARSAATASDCPAGGARRWLRRRARPGSPASASFPGSAKAPRRIGRS